MKKFNRFGYVYKLLKKRHPNWSHGQLRHCTAYALKINLRRKVDEI